MIDIDDLVFGIRTALLGMGLVFGLLAGLWVALEAVLRLERGTDAGARRAVGSGPGDGRRPANGVAAGTESGDAPDPALVAAIAIAVERHVDERRREAAPAMRAYWPGSLLYASRWVASGRTRQNRCWQRGGRR